MKIQRTDDLNALLHPEPESDEDDLAAIQEALDDMTAGDEGRPVEDVLSEIRTKYGLTGK